MNDTRIDPTTSEPQKEATPNAAETPQLPAIAQASIEELAREEAAATEAARETAHVADFAEARRGKAWWAFRKALDAAFDELLALGKPIRWGPTGWKSTACEKCRDKAGGDDDVPF